MLDGEVGGIAIVDRPVTRKYALQELLDERKRDLLGWHRFI
jgi:hypothetical protein